jgi:hypothetical protein
MSTTTQTIEQQKRHHAALETLAQSVGCKASGFQLWRKLRRLEQAVSYACLEYSNDSSFGIERWEKVKADAKEELAEIFGGTIPKGVFINGDPRGHALKLDNDEVVIPPGMEKDWGGNGILAATIN